MSVIAPGESIRSSGAQRVLVWAACAVPLTACLAIVVAKFLLVGRINISWDEFFYLSAVHEAARGELTLVLQGAYTHLFQWLTRLDADEVGQVVAARVAMAALLAATALLLWRLASTWVARTTALLAPLSYLSITVVLQHGASFRADSMLAPLCMLAAVLVRKNPGLRAAALAGVCLGAALAISIKAVLFAPVILVLVALDTDADGRVLLPRNARTLGAIAGAAGVTALALILLHKLSVAAADTTMTAYASRSFAKTIGDVPFFPRHAEYEWIKSQNLLAWLLLVAGALCAVVRPRFRRAAACGLSLLPLLFYRNAWPYYYIVMLAPACVLAAVAAENVGDLLQRLRWPAGPELATLTLSVLLTIAAVRHLSPLQADEQVAQREVVAAVHRIFPQAVPYIDHSGMIGGFRKVNFFMSTWGVEDYRASGSSFIERALAARAPLLLANRPVLDQRSRSFDAELLPRDRELIRQFYQPYWGPISVAGASVELISRQPRHVELPFPGRYRVESEDPIVIDDVVRRNGEVIDIEQPAVRISAVSEPEPAAAREVRVRLIWAAAQAPPSATPPKQRLYEPIRN
jgi:hypothetical protein